jgi:hypothetical protein
VGSTKKEKEKEKKKRKANKLEEAKLCRQGGGRKEAIRKAEKSRPGRAHQWRVKRKSEWAWRRFIKI